MAWRGGQGQGAGSPFFFEGEFPLAKRAYLIALPESRGGPTSRNNYINFAWGPNMSLKKG